MKIKYVTKPHIRKHCQITVITWAKNLVQISKKTKQFFGFKPEQMSHHYDFNNFSMKRRIVKKKIILTDIAT